MIEQLTPEHFLPYVNGSFHVPDWPHPLTLEMVDRRPMLEWEKQLLPREPFNLIFSGPPGEVLREGLYTLRAVGGPSFDLYVIPVHTARRDRQNYQATFN